MDEKKSSKNKNSKKRNWAFVLYPESMPETWEMQLQKTGLQCVISPLHDKDTDPTGEIKKAHYHVIVTYNGPTSFNVVKALTDSLNSPIPQALEQIRGYYRYLTHKDNPEKYQYDERDIKTINGFSISNFVELSRAEVNEIKKQLQMLIRENDIIEYSDLMDYLIDNNRSSEYEVASNNTYFFDKYITSKRNKANNQIVSTVDDKERLEKARETKERSKKEMAALDTAQKLRAEVDSEYKRSVDIITKIEEKEEENQKNKLKSKQKRCSQ